MPSLPGFQRIKKGVVGLPPTTPENGHKKAKEPPTLQRLFALIVFFGLCVQIGLNSYRLFCRLRLALVLSLTGLACSATSSACLAVASLSFLACSLASLVSIGIPRLNGIEATKLIRAACPGITIIILSTYSHESHMLASLRAGAAGDIC